MTNAIALPPISFGAGQIPPQQQGLPAAPDKTAAAAKDFEAVFVSEMLSHMFEGVGADPMFGGGQGEEMFRGMLVQEYGKQMVKGHSLGIADQLQKMMIQMQQK